MSNNRDLSLAMRLYADASRFVSGMVSGERGIKGFGNTVRHELDGMRSGFNSMQGLVTQLGLSIGFVGNQVQSARMDKGLAQIGQTADLSKKDVAGLRSELFSMAQETGESVDELQNSFNNAVQSGLNLKEALPVVGAVNMAVAVTGAAADRLTSGLTVAAQAFQFDLSKPGMATEILDKMTVAGRKGNAELQNLSDIFARVGVNASSAGMGFNQTLAFIEGLSLVERQPERLATLADSTLRLFTNMNYAKAAAKATGVRFFDQKTGDRRDPVQILRDLKSEYDKLGTDKGRSVWMQKAFGKADLDTIKGLRTLFQGDMLDKVGQFSAEISTASGTLKKDLPDAIDNAVNQTGRLKATLRESADAFAKPINAVYDKMIRHALDKKEEGGLGLSGGEIMLGGAAALGVGMLGKRYAGKAMGKLVDKFGGTATGVAEGKALEAMAGVTPVYVVNMPGGGMTAGGIDIGAPAAAGPGAAGAGAAAKTIGWRAAGLAALPLTAMYGVTQWAADHTHDKERVDGLQGVGSTVDRLLSYIGINFSDRIEARRAASRAELGGPAEAKLSGELRIKVSQDGALTSVRATSRTPGVDMNVDAGLGMMAP